MLVRLSNGTLQLRRLFPMGMVALGESRLHDPVRIRRHFTFSLRFVCFGALARGNGNFEVAQLMFVFGPESRE